jgi:hypothetical protein
VQEHHQFFTLQKVLKGLEDVVDTKLAQVALIRCAQFRPA